MSIDRDLDPASFSRAVIRDDTDFDYVLAGGGIGGKIVFTGAEKKLVSEGDICVGEFSRFFHFVVSSVKGNTALPHTVYN